jgi:hypothetical protein
MTKIALVLAIVAIGEGAVTLHLVNQLHEERASAQKLQVRVAELESRAPQGAPGATFVAVPTQPTVSPFTVARKDGAPPTPQAVAGVITSANVAMANAVVPMVAPDPEQVREQIKQTMERQAALMRDPEYREAMLAQQKLGLRQSNPNLVRDLDLTAEQADRLFTTLAEQHMRAMETPTPWIGGEQPDPAKVQEFQNKMMEVQSANDAEVKRVLGDAKYREWQEYQSLTAVRWEADRVRGALASAGMPLDESLTKPLLKTLQDEQQKMMQQMTAASSPMKANGNVVEMQEKSLDFMAQSQKRQRDALARVLTPEQVKVLEDEHNAQLQMQRAQVRMLRAQQEAGLLDQSGNSVNVQGEAVTFTPAFHD